MDADLQCEGVEKLDLLNHILNKAAAVKKESFSDDEMNLQDPDEHTSSDEVLAHKEVGELISPTSDAVKYEYEEITIEETRLIAANYNESDQCSEKQNSISDDSFNKQEVEDDVTGNKGRYFNYNALPKIFDVYPAVKFGCCGCISSFDTIEELRAHGREEHCDADLNNFTLKERQCDICFKVLHHRKAYFFHKKNFMYNYRCQSCDKILITIYQAFAHYQLNHKQRHLTAEELLICCGCKIRFRSAEALRIHSETIHLPEKPPSGDKKSVTCNICYRNYASKYKLRAHKLGYLRRRRDYHCKECDKSFRDHMDIKRHEASIHAKSGYLERRINCHCRECGKSFRTLSDLGHHEKSCDAKSHIAPITFDHATTSRPNADKHKYKEMIIDETRIMDANCSESDSALENVDKNSSNYQARKTNVCKHKRRSFDYSRVLKTFDKYPAVKLRCCGCTSSFDTIEELRAHGREKHWYKDLECFTLKERQCDICFKILSNGKTYDFHRKNVLYNYRCKICDKNVLTLKQTYAHTRIKHTTQKKPTADEALICCGCNMRFRSAEELRIHSKTIHLPEKHPSDEKKPITCNICYRNYSNKYRLRSHKLRYLVLGRKYNCKECGKSFRDLWVLRRHEKTHNKPVTLIATTSTPDALKHEYGEITIEETRIMDANYSESDPCSESKDSVSQNVDENSYNSQEVEAKLPKIFERIPAIKLSCCGCISSFDTIEELRAHSREKHCDKDLESFFLQKRQCDICFKVLHSELAYDFHKKNVMHNYRCQICDEILITMKQAIAHYRLKHTVRTPTADEALICCGCKIRFLSAEALRDHSVTIHLPAKPPPDEKKPVTCNICYCNVSTVVALRRHKLAYLDRTCEKCGKLFGRRSNLRRHEPSCHTKSGDLERTKNYHCKECDKSYYSSYELKRHEKSRHGKSSYLEPSLERSKNHHCKECGKSFPFPSRLRLHERKCPAKSHISSVTFDHATTRLPDAVKHEYEEITIEEIRIVDVTYSKSDQCSESKNSISDDVDENSSKNQELEQGTD